MNAPENPVRSPSYPVMSLADAITAVGKIEGQYRASKVDREVAAKMIGYSGLSGPANKALAALAQYGLVERAGKGEMRVTARARAILHPDSAEEKRRELREAAMEPALFREMQERWPDMIPPEDGVISYFNRRGFNPSAIRPAAKAYLQTLLFLEEAGASESHGVADGEAPITGSLNATLEPITMKSTATVGSQQPSAPASHQPVAPPGLNRIDMNIQGDKVHLNALLNAQGLLDLENKLKALKLLLPVQVHVSGAGSEPDEGKDDRQTQNPS